MQEQVTGKSHRMLFFNTLAFTVCFAVWVSNGVMITFLVDNDVFNWDSVQIGWLMGIPILTGSIFRLPMGMLTDKFGGKWVYSALLFFCAVPMFLLSYATTYWHFVLAGLGYGMAGTGFAIGIVNTSVWFPKHWQGRALGIFGVGNAGAAVTTLLAPKILQILTNSGDFTENWRMLPKLYALVLVVMGILFVLFTENKKHAIQNRTTRQLLQPLKNIRVWRFGLYYFLVFGCFVAFSQWLMPYFVNVYGASLVIAGLLTSLFSLPSGVIRALGGWMSDKWGARQVMVWVFVLSMLCSFFLSVPRMEIYSPGKGIMAARSGIVREVSDTHIRVDVKQYKVLSKSGLNQNYDENFLIFPTKDQWQEPVVKTGDVVKKKQLLAKGVTRIYFQANLWIFAFLVLFIGIVWGIGKAGVYRFIPDYFPNEVGVVGGMVGVIGGLGGFICPILFGYLLKWTGLWTSCWMLMLVLSVACHLWMRSTVKKLTKEAAPEIAGDFDRKS
ncbi:MAG: MFS transporter [Sphingobacteriales bacterium]|nr:MFS transporter [Sphingobacteriales bacterium]